MAMEHGPTMRNGISSALLILAVAVFVAMFSNAAFFANVVGVYGVSAKSAPFIASLFCFITSIFVLILSAVCHRALVKPMLMAFLLLASAIAYFANSYGTVFDYRMIGNVLETNTGEARDLLNISLLLYVLLLGVLPSVVVYFVPLRRPGWKAETMSRLKLAGGAAAMIALIQVGFGGNYAALVREHSNVLAKVNPSYALFSAAKLAVRSVPAATPRARVVVGPDAKLPPADHSRELVIMVVGETARADHWSLNGYSRITNPMLAREDVINFPNFWACGTSTSVSVPCMFSRLGRAGLKGDAGKGEENALDVLARAGVSILWRDNNSDSKGVALRVPYENFRSPDVNPVCDEVECRDEGMLHGLQQFIDAQKGDILIVLHQMGNHGPAYYKRYPKAFERFTPVCRTNDLGSCTSEEIHNAYDNAILYTDYFLSKVIELLKQNDDRFETAMFYVSDHGESLGEFGVYLHGMPYGIAPAAQKHVPAVAWIGKHMRHDIKLDGMEERRQRQWSHDNVFSTLLGLFEIETAAYDPNKDLFEHTTRVTAVRKAE
jgi:lipid A ethanolaminephosphotransferase